VFMCHDTTGEIAARQEFPSLVQILATGRRTTGLKVADPSPGRSPRAARGRQCEHAAFGCSRSAGILTRSMLATCERLLSLSLTLSSA
jgi:hypothetical protein